MSDEKVAKALEIMKQALQEVTEGKNLEKWSKDIDEALKEVEMSMNASKKKEPFRKLKNELFYLKYLIAEKT